MWMFVMRLPSAQTRYAQGSGNFLTVCCLKLASLLPCYLRFYGGILSVFGHFKTAVLQFAQFFSHLKGNYQIGS